MLWSSWRVGFLMIDSPQAARCWPTSGTCTDCEAAALVATRRGGSADVPPGRFVAAQDAHQRHTSALEVEKRVVAAEAAQELSRAPRRTIHESLWGLCKGDCSFLCRVRNHLRDPLSRRYATVLVCVAQLRDSSPVLQDRCHAKMPFSRNLASRIQDCQYSTAECGNSRDSGGIVASAYGGGGPDHRSRNNALTTKLRLAGRSPSRRMK